MSSNQNQSAGSARRTERGGVRAVGVGRINPNAERAAAAAEEAALDREAELLAVVEEWD